jgi:addiction module HigA family antidote
LARRKSTSSAGKPGNSNSRESEPIRPGDVLREHVLEALNLTQEELANALGVSRYSVNQLVNDRRAITAEMALRLAKATSTTPLFWLELQRNVDLARAQRRLDRKKELARVIVVRRPLSNDEMYVSSEE